jgi:hypothetical protein
LRRGARGFVQADVTAQQRCRVSIVVHSLARLKIVQKKALGLFGSAQARVLSARVVEWPSLSHLFL